MIKNETTDLIDKLCLKYIAGYEPTKNLIVNGVYAPTDETTNTKQQRVVMTVQPKALTSLTINIGS